ncbi:type II secretion system protein N [Novilysobacter arseniciresistens]|uniref:type II secretion system protein N n=1 Tax=Novilysobacter arseniciresistens TaxID=1385522 RepID=UPI0009E0134E|nr:type II secretion system protein N [Lysobacter arseniciresistens]
MHFPALPHRSVLADWRRWLPVATEIVLASLLVLQAGRIALVFAMPAPVDAGAPADVAAAEMADVSPAPALPSIDVFFRTTTPAASRGEAMGYRLFGVRRDGDGGSAILGKDDLQASYAVGREVAPGVVLESVGDDHAVLLAGGTRHRLELPEHDAVAAMGPGSRPARRTGAASRPASADQVAAPITGASTRNADRSPAATSPARPEPANSAPLTLDIRKLVTQAGLRPNLAGGFTLSSGGDGALLAQAGLAPGDVLLALDGKPLTVASVSGLASQLQGRSEVQLRFRRDGRVHTTTLKAPR